MEKLADGLQKLGEDDLLQVVQMVHDNKTNETYTKNDVESTSWRIRGVSWQYSTNVALRRRISRRSLHSSR